MQLLLTWIKEPPLSPLLDTLMLDGEGGEQETVACGPQSFFEPEGEVQQQHILLGATKKSIMNMPMINIQTALVEDSGARPSIALAVQEIAERGFAVISNVLPADLVSELRAHCLASWHEGAFRIAGVGRGASLRVRPEIRNDSVLWLGEEWGGGALRGYRDVLEELRLAVNQALFLGLVEFEGHLSVYPPGAYYRRHLDQFRDVGLRALTCILYLNNGWAPEDGGKLRIFFDKDALSPYLDVEPMGGTFVSFLSADFFHEVLPARKPRLALTGWFKRRD